jgi:LacI family transcriptional regulator
MIREEKDESRHDPVGKTPRRPTINDLAEAVGLSKGTVSRALNDYPDIAESTRQRVKKAAQRMGYQPLSHAQAIRTGRVRALALVLQIDEYDGQAPFLTNFLAGLTQFASGLGWTLTISSARSEAEMLEVLGRLIDERKTDGFILPRTAVNDPRIAFLQARQVPYVLFGRTQYGVKDGLAAHSWYDVSGEEAMRLAVQRLADQGHQRIGYIGGGNQYNYSHLRREGYLTGLHESGLPVDHELIHARARVQADGRGAAYEMLALQHPPTAILAATDMAALGACAAVRDAGLRVGCDVSVIGYDGIPEGAAAQPGLTSFKVDLFKAGEQLADFLIRQIRGEDPGTLQELAFAELIARESDGPPAMSSAQLRTRLDSLKTNPMGGYT